MRVLAFASQKSGAGKTTLASHVAMQAYSSGLKAVALVDADPDGSLSDWCSLRESPTPKLTRAAMPELAEKLDQLRQDGIELVVIDTPPALNHSIDTSIAVADLVAIPTRPCAHDLEAAGATVELVAERGKPFVFIVNGNTPEGDLTPEVVMALAQHGPVATVAIPRHVAFVEGMIDGRTIMEISDEPTPTNEVAKLWQYLSQRLPGIVRAASAAPAADDIAAIPRNGTAKPSKAALISAAAGAAPESNLGPAAAPAPSAAADAPATAVAASPSRVEPAPMPATDAPAPDAAAPASAIPVAASSATAASPNRVEPAPKADTTALPNPEQMRRYPRFVYEQAASINIGNSKFDCFVHDISAGGALLSIGTSLEVGETVTLSLPTIGQLQAEVRHFEAGRAGIRFLIEPKVQLSLVKHLSALVAAGNRPMTT